ncbi:ankyrin repeat domain-containing protein [Treponema sp. R80B11-R83G3]
MLINKGADVNYQDWYGSTCLHMAIYERSYSSMKCLFEHGANPNLISIEDSHTVLDFAYDEYCMSDDKEDENKLIEIIKLVLHYGGKSHEHLFTKNVDTYLLIDHYYPTGLFTKDGNILVEDIPNIDQLKVEEFYYWLLMRPADRLFQNEREHPLVRTFYKRQDEWCDYFSGLLGDQIIIGNNSVKISGDVCDRREKAYKQKEE